LFLEVKSVRSSNPASVATSDTGSVIFLDVDGWFMRVRRKMRPEKIPIDPVKQQGLPWVSSFLDGVESLMKKAGVEQ
jgi:hypothetical protein